MVNLDWSVQALLPIQTHEEQLDMETAWAVGFNALSLSEEEEGLLPEGSNQAIYCKVRTTQKHQLWSDAWVRLCPCQRLRLPCWAVMTLCALHACRCATTS